MSPQSFNLTALSYSLRVSLQKPDYSTLHHVLPAAHSASHSALFLFSRKGWREELRKYSTVHTDGRDYMRKNDQ